MAQRKPGNAQVQPVEEQWCFGGVDLVTGDFFLRLVPRGDERTLLQVIQTYVTPGSWVSSDEWAAYQNLIINGYVHETVNHSHNSGTSHRPLIYTAWQIEAAFTHDME